MGLYLDSIHDTVKYQTASVYNEYMELDMNSGKFKSIRAFVNEDECIDYIINKVKGYKKRSMASLNFIQKIRHVAKNSVKVFQ